MVRRKTPTGRFPPDVAGDPPEHGVAGGGVRPLGLRRAHEDREHEETLLRSFTAA